MQLKVGSVLLVMCFLTRTVPTEAVIQVATGKPASQSSTHSILVASRAVDGNKGDKYMDGCSHTAVNHQTAWWRVDLQKIYLIQRILIFPRPHNVTETEGRFAGFSVAVSESEEDGYFVCFDYGKNSSLPDVLITHVVNCTPAVPGRYVKISNNRNDPPYGDGYSSDAYVNLCEVEIFVEECPENCIDCVCSACKDKFYGVKCNQSCSIHCGGDGTCNQADGRCKNQSCTPGYYGERCTKTCSSNCVGNACDIYTGYCDKCNGSYYGTNCSSSCPSNCVICKSQTECKECKKGFTGMICEEACPPCGGDGSCHLDSGLCSSNSCRAGFYGDDNKCDKICSATCGSDGSCDLMNGSCVYGCDPGFSGLTCQDKCPGHCRACDQLTRNCTHGCISGYHGSSCELMCPENCGGNGECNITGGICTYGCKSGWEGSLCSQVSVNDDGTSTAAIGGALGGIIVIILGVIVLVIIVRRRTRDEEPKSESFTANSPNKATESSVNTQPDIGRTYGGTSIETENGISSNNVILKMDADENTYCNTPQNLLGISIESLRDHVSKMNARKGLAEEFAGIPYGERHAATAGQQPENVPKNRYKTTFPYDHSRVLLQGQSDYINANYIEDTEGNRKYIASQGPTKNSVADFWQMVWQDSVEVIVMLTNLTEGTKKKCEKYWPDQNMDKTYGQLKLTFKDERTFYFYVLREMTIEDVKLKTRRIIFQFHFTTWPDHGTPDPFLLVTFHRRVIAQQQDMKAPLLVHCSAGVGRTGTFIALDALQKQGENTGRINVEAYVRTMRKDRMNMIQNAEQYKMLHEALVEAFQWQDTSTTMDKFPALWETISYDRQPLNHQKLKKEYDMLMKLKSEVNNEDTSTARKEENKGKNRNTEILPSDKHRPQLSSCIKGGTNYINCVIVPSHISMNAYFVTQTPLPSTVLDFWRLLYDHDSYCIIHFISDSDDKVTFYPTNDDVFETDLHQVTKEFSREHQENIYEIKLRMKDKNSEHSKDVTLLRVDLGIERLVSPAKVFKATEVVETFRKKHEESPVTVVSSDGCSHCDVFCTIANTIEYMKIDNRVDIYQTVRQLLFRRPEFFRSYETYRYCYQIVNEYLSTESVYFN